MKIDDYFKDFIRTEFRYDRSLKDTAEKLLLSGRNDSLRVQPGFEESGYLEINMRASVRSCVRGKDTAIEVYKRLVRYLQKQGVPVNVTFPPIPVDSSFERLMFIAKFLHDPERKIAELPGVLWVSERTIEEDLKRLRGVDDPIQICGKRFVIEDTDRSNGYMRFASTAHPLFLTENLTQVIIMLKGLKEMAADPFYTHYARATAEDIWEQLSDYAKNRIRFVLSDLLPEDLSWYESLEREEEDAFYTERGLSVRGNVWMDCMKNEKPFCIEYEEQGETVIFKDCRIIHGTYKENRFDVMTAGQRKTIDLDRVIRSAYTLEELLTF